MKKLLGDERRKFLLNLLKEKTSPITGSELSKIVSVSRQVIVNDITLLKAKNEPIIATSQGYLYITSANPSESFERRIACNHRAEDTEDELLTLIDCGVTVKDVTVEHSIYGEINASIMVSNRHDVSQFLKQVEETESGYLLDLTGGIHLHTLTASSEEILDRAVEAMREKGYLLKE